jgi:hypothetical protein
MKVTKLTRSCLAGPDRRITASDLARRYLHPDDLLSPRSDAGSRAARAVFVFP